jgi:hypothetical protein
MLLIVYGTTIMAVVLATALLIRILPAMHEHKALVFALPGVAAAIGLMLETFS